MRLLKNSKTDNYRQEVKRRQAVESKDTARTVVNTRTVTECAKKT
jgi:hypothetical protein